MLKLLEWFRSLFRGKTDRPFRNGRSVLLDGTECWMRGGQYHREDGPAVIKPNGEKWWYVDGKQHREWGPAVELPDGTKLYFLHGRPHRKDGPAVEMANGTKSWFIHGMAASEEEFNRRWGK